MDDKIYSEIDDLLWRTWVNINRAYDVWRREGVDIGLKKEMIINPLNTAMEYIKVAIAEAEAKFQCQRCLKITSMSEQCYDESADIIVCSACSRELTRLDDGPGRYVAHIEAEKEKP